MPGKTKPTFLNELVAAIMAEYGLPQVDDLAKIERVGFVRSPRLLVAKHFEPNIDILIVDRLLGTLGVVCVLPFDESEQSKRAQRVEAFVGEATYLMHLLVTDPKLDGALPYSVELVLVVKGEVGSVGDVLRSRSTQPGG